MVRTTKLDRSKEWIESRKEIGPGGCWLWKGGKNSKGYASTGNGTIWENGHRLAWRTFNGPIPDGLYVLHKCDVRHCVNPEHLFLGTHTDNVRDMWSKGRGARPGTKLLPEQVMEIRSSEESHAALARKHGVTATAIRYIRSRRTWKHL